MRRMIGFTGYAGAGKNEAARGIADTHVPVAFAGKIREGLLSLNPIVYCGVDNNGLVVKRLRDIVDLLGWDEAKKIAEVRNLLQRYGSEAGRSIHGSMCWVVVAGREIRKLLFDGKNVAVTDVRFEEESNAIYGFGGVIVKIVKPNNGPVNDHYSEHQDVKFDATIVNDGTIEDLHRKVRAFVN